MRTAYSISSFSPRWQVGSISGYPVGARSWNGLPGGVQKGGPSNARWRAMAGILSPLLPYFRCLIRWWCKKLIITLIILNPISNLIRYASQCKCPTLGQWLLQGRAEPSRSLWGRIAQRLLPAKVQNNHDHRGIYEEYHQWKSILPKVFWDQDVAMSATSHSWCLAEEVPQNLQRSEPGSRWCWWIAHAW